MLHLQTELGSKAQTKLEMMLDETEPMEFFEILHFENILKSYFHLGSQCDVLRITDILGMKALLLQKLFATLHSLSESEIQSEAPINSASYLSAGLSDDKAAAKGLKDEKRFPESENKLGLSSLEMMPLQSKQHFLD